jgi:hypothetical protein
VPINTKIEGSPDSIRQAATWLRSSLQAGVHDCASQVYQARTHAESGWRGETSSAFRGKMTTAAQGSDVVATDSGQLSQSFDLYADGLHTAQAGMRRAKEIAHQGGLTVNGDTIEDPGPAPSAPQSLRTDGSTTPRQVQDHNAAVQAGQDYQKKVEAFNQAKGEADRANDILGGARKTAEDFWKDLSSKKYVHATNFTNGVAGDLIKLHRSILTKESSRLLDEAKTAEGRYLKSPGGSAEAKFQERIRLAKTMGASDLEAEAASVGRRFASKIPIIGWGITAAGIGWDIHNGKPPGKAIFAGVAGTAGAMLAASAVGGPVGLAAGVGVVAGVGIGLGADWVYDHVIPDGVKHKIDDGLDAAGHGLANAGKAVGHSSARCSRRVPVRTTSAVTATQVSER